METLIAQRLRIHGRVQGVGYRDSMRREAESLGLSGWVRNCPDGTVEALVQGRQESVDRLVDWAGQGPRFAKVERVERLPASIETDAIPGFTIRFD